MMFDLPRYPLAIKLVVLLLVNIDLAAASGGKVDVTYDNMRPRLGHFARVEGYLEIYKEYFTQVIQPNDVELQNIGIIDWRNYRPTSDLCVNFLQSFLDRGLMLLKPYDIILVDACLEWLFEESYEKTEDLKEFNEYQLEELKSLEKEEDLKSIYKETAFKNDKVPEEVKVKLHEYLSRLLKINHDDPENGCHSFWLEAYNDFIEHQYLTKECVDEENCVYFGVEGLADDPYMELIVESTKEASLSCYDVMQQHMIALVDILGDKQTTITKKLLAKAKKTSKSKGLDDGMSKILELASGVSDRSRAVTLSESVTDLKAIKTNVCKKTSRIRKARNQEKTDPTVAKFLDAIQKYATNNVDFKDSSNDNNGRIRYGKAMTRLCKNYIDGEFFMAKTGGKLEDADPKRPFDFYRIIYGLVRMTNHVPIFGITKEQFENDIITNNWPTLYLTTFTCQLISTTFGELSNMLNVKTYTIGMRREANLMVEDWPIEVLYQKLAHSDPIPDAVAAVTEPSTVEAGDDQVTDAPTEAPEKKSGRPRKHKLFGFVKPSSKSKDINTASSEPVMAFPPATPLHNASPIHPSYSVPASPAHYPPSSPYVMPYSATGSYAAAPTYSAPPSYAAAPTYSASPSYAAAPTYLVPISPTRDTGAPKKSYKDAVLDGAKKTIKFETQPSGSGMSAETKEMWERLHNRKMKEPLVKVKPDKRHYDMNYPLNYGSEVVRGNSISPEDFKVSHSEKDINNSNNNNNSPSKRMESRMLDF